MRRAPCCKPPGLQPVQEVQRVRYLHTLYKLVPDWELSRSPVRHQNLTSTTDPQHPTWARELTSSMYVLLLLPLQGEVLIGLDHPFRVVIIRRLLCQRRRKRFFALQQRCALPPPPLQLLRREPPALQEPRLHPRWHHIRRRGYKRLARQAPQPEPRQRRAPPQEGPDQAQLCQECRRGLARRRAERWQGRLGRPRHLQGLH